MSVGTEFEFSFSIFILSEPSLWNGATRLPFWTPQLAFLEMSLQLVILRAVAPGDSSSDHVDKEGEPSHWLVLSLH